MDAPTPLPLVAKSRFAYAKGALWVIAVCLFSILNDSLFKKLGGVYGINILFFRFFFSTLCFLPLILVRPHLFSTKNMLAHCLRGGLFALAMMPWSYGIIQLPLPLLTTLSFTTPLFVVVMAKIFLNERVGWRRWGATVLGFLGILASVQFSLQGAHNAVIWALLATVLFAALDILNKYLLCVEEPLAPMMFFSALWTMIFSAPLALYNWHWPAAEDWVPLLLLGLSANAMLYCLLMSFQKCDISALQPIRYLEFVLSCVVSILFFSKWPSRSDLLAMALIVPATLYLAHDEIGKNRHNDIPRDPELPPEAASLEKQDGSR